MISFDVTWCYMMLFAVTVHDVLQFVILYDVRWCYVMLNCFFECNMMLYDYMMLCDVIWCLWCSMCMIVHVHCGCVHVFPIWDGTIPLDHICSVVKNHNSPWCSYVYQLTPNKIPYSLVNWQKYAVKSHYLMGKPTLNVNVQ